MAFWLHRYGWHTTLVERAPAFRTGGQNVDVRDAGREVLRRAGLEDAVRAATTGEQGTRFVDGRGATVAEFPVVRSDTEGAKAEVEVLHGDLARILLDAAGDETETVFGDSVTGLKDDGEAVEVTFTRGARSVSAPGCRGSRTR